MEQNSVFVGKYIEFVAALDDLQCRPSLVTNYCDGQIENVDIYCRKLVAQLTTLNGYPLLAESLYQSIGRADMTGVLGEYVIDNAVVMCGMFADKEMAICGAVDHIKNNTDASDKSVLDDIAAKARCWRKMVSLDNIRWVNDYMDSLKRRVDDFYENLSAQEKLGKALAKSEEERRRLIEMEEARKRGISEKELDKEEKRRKAREEFAKRSRKKK